MKSIDFRTNWIPDFLPIGSLWLETSATALRGPYVKIDISSWRVWISVKNGASSGCRLVHSSSAQPLLLSTLRTCHFEITMAPTFTKAVSCQATQHWIRKAAVCFWFSSAASSKHVQEKKENMIRYHLPRWFFASLALFWRSLSLSCRLLSWRTAIYRNSPSSCRFFSKSFRRLAFEAMAHHWGLWRVKCSEFGDNHI